MNASARFVLDRDYFECSFDDWLRSRSRFRRWQLWMSLLLAGAGCISLLARIRFPELGITLILIGAIEFIEFYWYRSRWLAQRLAARNNEPGVVEMRFDDSGMHISGPTANGHVSWAGVRGVTEAKGGIFLSIGDGIIMYIPRSSISPPKAVTSIVKWAASGPRTS